MTTFTPREEWAEQEAAFCDRMINEYERMAKDWADKSPHEESYGMAQKCMIYAEAWQQMAWNLRKPRNIRLEQEQYDVHQR